MAVTTGRRPSGTLLVVKSICLDGMKDKAMKDKAMKKDGMMKDDAMKKKP